MLAALESFSMYPDAPALSIGNTVSLPSSVVTARILTSGQRSLMTAVASMPFISGICTSIITTSGRSRSTVSMPSDPTPPRRPP